ncbi:transport and Golgi organization protein 2 isoform X2 [Pararge aegeria]|uniref:transport and Golgi organization protein 2 isoform X2 n=1 Tax=Pararge aegeria TaxID=116150 RepID=UPI0019D1ABBF|nr:transport and Golgi organization protein 2 isoform X2 [Pararge aegeria]
MCIVFIYNGVNETESDYSLILISNRDEHFERPAQCMAPWNEDSNVYGGKDLEPGCEGGTWMAVSPTRGKLGLLLNLPGVKKESAKSRGRIVSDYMKSTMPLSEYVEFIHNYSMQCNVFLFLSVDFGTPTPKIKTYSNATDNIYQWPDTYLGFSNSLPDKPLKKVEAGKNYLTDICGRLNKIMDKSQLIDELTCLLKNKESHLPDDQLESRQPKLYKELSSIFVDIPQGKYGTRAHTIMLLSKSGHMDLIEISMQSPIDPEKPHWEKSAFQFDLIK